MTIVGIVGDIRDQRLEEAPRAAAVPAAQPDADDDELSIARAGDRDARGRRAGCSDFGHARCRAVSQSLSPRVRRADTRHDRRHIARAAAVHDDAAEPLCAGRTHTRRVGDLRRAPPPFQGAPRNSASAAPSARSRPRLMRDVLVQGLQPVVLGLVCGLAASVWTTRLLGYPALRRFADRSRDLCCCRACGGRGGSGRLPDSCRACPAGQSARGAEGGIARFHVRFPGRALSAATISSRSNQFLLPGIFR